MRYIKDIPSFIYMLLYRQFVHARIVNQVSRKFVYLRLTMSATFNSVQGRKNVSSSELHSAVDWPYHYPWNVRERLSHPKNKTKTKKPRISWRIASCGPRVKTKRSRRDQCEFGKPRRLCFCKWKVYPRGIQQQMSHEFPIPAWS